MSIALHIFVENKRIEYDKSYPSRLAHSGYNGPDKIYILDDSTY